MAWQTWVVLFLAVSAGGWMLFDGARALVVGDYVTPKSGEYKGQLGPWAKVVEAAVAVAALWYLPFGSLSGLLQVGLLAWMRFKV